MEKIYVKQVAPEYQESPLFIDGFFPENIAVFGNRDYIEHCPDYIKNVRDVLNSNDLAYMIGDPGYMKEFYKNVTECITDCLPPVKEKYTTRDIGALKKLISDYYYAACYESHKLTAKILSIMTGEKWEYKQISGCCQSDWNYILYPVAEWSDDAINAFETMYFNTGSEWIVDDGEYNPETCDPGAIGGGCSVYCTSWNDDGIKAEIADAIGAEVENIVLYKFGGWNRSAVYAEVEA